MRIEKIELIGFKSFSERTAFNLHPGITCIVGPNGCGKSNVVDAFRWALGEQSAKSLRGEKMEEVIFNGSSTKKPKGMAEVTLVVSGMGDPTQDNGDDPQNFTSVTRRLYRSGESEYIANKSVCRLKDIKDLFLDTGLEVKSYSILEQDRIAAILNSKPQDRRFIIEEVAGVMKYKVRKTEAQNKLEASRLNLQRINDIVSEVKRQINALDRQAKKAERYKKLSAETRTIELKLAKRDYHALRESLEKILAEFTVLKENEELKKAELTKIENISETNRLGIFEKEKALEIIQQEFRDVERAIAETERVIAVLNTDRDNLKEYLAKLFTQREEFETKKKELSEKLGELNGTDVKLSGDIEELKEELKLKNELIESVENELLEKESSVDSKRRNVFTASEELSALRNETGRMQASLEALERKEVSLIKDAEDSKKVLGEIDLSIRDVEGSLRDKNSEALLLSEKKSVYTSEVSSLRENIEHLRDELSKTKEDLASNTSRMDSLKELVLDAPTREILQEGSNLHIVSSLSDMLNVEPEYEKAIENALSEKINSFILKSLADIETAISTLKSKGMGRMSFIPLDSRITDEPSDVPAGIIGRALDFVRVDAEFAGIAKNLLKNIFIVKDLKTALAMRESGNNFLFVTLDGEIVEPSGAVIGGEGRGVLKRKRELREIEELIGHKTGSISVLQEDLNRLQQELSEKESGIKDIEAAIVNAEKEMSLSKLTSANYQEEKDRTDRKLAYLAVEVEEIVREKESLKSMIGEKERAISAGESEKSAIEKDMTGLLEEIIQQKMRYEEDRSHITDLRLSITAHKEKIEAAQKEIETTGNALEELSQKDNLLTEEMKSVEGRISQREAESGENEEKIKGMVLNADRLRDDISARKEALEQENQQMLLYEQAVKALRHEIDALTSKVSSLDVERAEHRLKIENLAENIRQNYGTEIDSLETEPVLPEDEERLAELRAKIQELGPVNLGTLEEYEELTTRYGFLSKQQEDLNRSIAELEEAITKINSTTRKKLREAFEALKVKFSEVFLSLFGGGRAELILTDESNILETGIDIIAQPPGKKLQNITLLSGGEKALTALSLLFASFLIKPTPLCILDEADAPLDDSNTGRFSRMLRELSTNIQFIVITHNRVTMEAADYIYGITTEEPGVSKVISMQLAEA
ncbi:MAG TPA: chromosome segregation protein SMC [Nitrospiraceae bacterium]|nr:MAG: chromosome segregation protein SMC [Nitrospirae bacterium RIFOXYA2_FULL_44_9]HBG92924.1 chromosome segregation protein SMC [Nitrospiraceae bacterium]